MGAATATVKGGLFEQYGNTLVTSRGRGAMRRRAAQALDSLGTLELRARMSALDGVAAGATATKTQTRIEANSEQGGLRAIETVNLINRATTAGDITEIEATVNSLSSKTTFGASPPANLDGNPLGTR